MLELMKVSWPEHDSRTLVTISYNLFFNGGYASLEKPIDQDIPDKYEKQIVYQIKVMALERLIKEGVKPRGKKAVVKKKPIEVTPQPEKRELIKMEAVGRKL